MNTINITLAVICIMLAASLIYSLYKQGKTEKKIEDMYVKCHVKLEIKNKKLLVIFFLPHGHHLLDPAFGKNQWISDIRDHLNINGYGEQGFRDSPWREHLRNHGYENADVLERAL
ncbi:hypothetical protein H7X65_03700 [Candidatus Parcubacteria bacterium]|nr:hypothetical protein [Candidatus Parcubacteria bacterium]